MVHWNRLETEKLIALFKVNKELWDVSHPDYKRRGRREFAVKEILIEFRNFFPNTAMTVKDIQNKIQSIRTQYRRELRIIQASIADGGQQKRPRLWFFDQLEFMRPLFQHGLSTSGIKERHIGFGSEETDFEEQFETNDDTTTFRASSAKKQKYIKPNRIEEINRNVDDREGWNRRKKREIARNFLEIFNQMDEMDSLDLEEYETSCSQKCALRRRMMDERETAAERRHRERMDATNKFLELFRELIDKI